jgi:hypothetical protein
MKQILAIILLIAVASSPYLYSSIGSGNVNTSTALTNGNPVCGLGGTQIQTCASSSGGGGITVYSGATALAATLYIPIGGGSLPSATESQPGTLVPATATVTNFGVNISAAVGIGNSVAFTWRDCPTPGFVCASQPLTCTISGAVATSCTDMNPAHAFTAAQGDKLDIQAVSTGTIAGTPILVMSAQFGTIGQGNINAGTINQTAYYAGAGTTLSGGGPGTAGQVWTSNGVGSPPSFQSASLGPTGVVAPPNISALTWVDQGGATGNTTAGVLTMNAPFAVGDNLRMLVKSLTLVGGTEATFTAGMWNTGFAVNYANIGIVMRESGTGKIASFSLGYSGVGLYNSYCMNAWTNETTYNAALATPVAASSGNFAFGVWLRMIYTVSGSTLTFQVSGDGGRNWYTILVYSIGGGVPFTTAPDQIGIYIDAANNTYGQTVAVYNWVES